MVMELTQVEGRMREAKVEAVTSSADTFLHTYGAIAAIRRDMMVTWTTVSAKRKDQILDLL